jgi:hypothetical protein
VSIGLVLALSNCSESGGDPDAMLDIHHTGPASMDAHHQQFHNSYGNMKNQSSFILKTTHYFERPFYLILFSLILIIFILELRSLKTLAHLTLNHGNSGNE